MPGKQDPDYFPLNLNMNGGLGFYSEVGPILIPHRHTGKFEGTGVGVVGSPIAMALHNSPVNATFLSDNLMSEYINLNVTNLPPVNSEDEEDDYDRVSQSGSESVSDIQGSDIDLDVEGMDEMDSLVLNIRDKLRMRTRGQEHPDYLWSDNNTPSAPSGVVVEGGREGDLFILPRSSSSAPTTSHPHSPSSKSSGGKRRPTPLPRSWRQPNSYLRQFHHHTTQGSINKASRKSNSFNNWWSSRSFGELSKQSRSKDALHLLQELLQSGTLIQEAVRRLNRKCLNSSSSSAPSNLPNNPQEGNASSNNSKLVVSTSKYSYMEEDSDSFSHPHHPSLAPCN